MEAKFLILATNGLMEIRELCTLEVLRKVFGEKDGGELYLSYDLIANGDFLLFLLMMEDEKVLHFIGKLLKEKDFRHRNSIGV